MVGIIHDSRALQALLQKYRDLPSRLSANTKQKTHQFVKVGIFKTICVEAFTNPNRTKNLDSGGMSTEAFGGAWLLFSEVLNSYMNI